jgi:hypothetical protein
VQVRYVKNSHLQCCWQTSKVTNFNTHCKSQTHCAGTVRCWVKLLHPWKG